MVSTGAFRADLYFRLKVLSLHISPLRERLDDLPPLLEHFAALTARRYGMPAPVFSPEFLETARRYGWPGNVRELAHVVERAVLLGVDRLIDAPALGLSASSPPPADPGRVLAGLTLEEAERHLIVDALGRDRRQRVGVGQAARGCLAWFFATAFRSSGLDPRRPRGC